jgi:uncharacterized protein (TIGR02448 family)
MKYALLLLVVIAGTQASAYSIAYNGGLMTMDPSYSSRSTSNIQYKTIINAAKDDAETFIATGGGVRGAQLEQAIIVLRAAGHSDTDEQLAYRIIAEEN